MKRFIRSNKYLDDDSDILFDDTIVVDIDIELPYYLISAATNQLKSKYPGLEQFKEDVLNILENEYHFEVIEDVYDGTLQKGHVTNRKNGTSIYFDTYFDLSNAQPSLDRIKSSLKAPDSGLIYCFIHIRFSDHPDRAGGDAAHRKFVKKNAARYKDKNPDVTFALEDEAFEIPKELLANYYEEAIDDLKSQLDARMVHWIHKANQYRKLGLV